jgi:hypothetical protein
MNSLGILASTVSCHVGGDCTPSDLFAVMPTHQLQGAESRGRAMQGLEPLHSPGMALPNNSITQFFLVFHNVSNLSLLSSQQSKSSFSTCVYVVKEGGPCHQQPLIRHMLPYLFTICEISVVVAPSATTLRVSASLARSRESGFYRVTQS